jgi:hypothetical protein
MMSGSLSLSPSLSLRLSFSSFLREQVWLLKVSKEVERVRKRFKG